MKNAFVLELNDSYQGPLGPVYMEVGGGGGAQVGELTRLSI